MHLTEYDIASYLDRKGEPAERLRVEQHLSDCSACATAFASAIRILQAVEKTEPPELPDSVFRKAVGILSGRKTRFFPMVRISLPVRYAFAALLVATVSWWISSSGRQDPPSRFRSTSPIPTVELRSPADNGVLSSLPVQFRWEPVPNTLRYRLILFDEEGRRLWQGESVEHHLDAPPTVVFEGGKMYLWTIEAVLSNGLTITSNLSSFRYAP